MIKKIFTVGVVVLTIFWAVGLAAFVPTAQATTFSSGDLIKASLPAVYYYGADGKRYVFPNEPTYKTWYADFSSVKTITDGELATIQIGGNVTNKPGVKMVKITTDPKVYAVAANGTLRWVTTESLAASLYGSNWGAMILDVSDAFFVNYSIGAQISNVSDYSPSAATAAAQSINVDKGLAGATTTGGNLNVSLASDTPAASTVAGGAAANMSKIILATGSAAVKVKSLYITRSGLSANDDVENVKLINVAGATVGDVGSFGSNSKALISFVPSLEIAANTSVSYYVRASIRLGAPAGNTVALGVALNTDVVLEAGTVSGAFPVVGNYMSIVALANIGSATVGQDAAVVDTMPDAGAKRVQVSEFYVMAGANEDLTIEAMSLIEAGSANTADSANIELYSLTEGRTLGTAASWDANSRVTVGSMNVVIPRGGKHIFQVYADIVSGSGNVIDVDLTDGTDVLVTVKGNTYGFYLSPIVAVTPPLNWDGQGIPGVGGQTVGAGLLNVTKSTSSPATGNIARASDQAIATYDYEVRGESIKITSTMVTITEGAAFNNVVPNWNRVANVKLVDENGLVVAGPKNLTNVSVGAAGGVTTVTFNETYVVPTGTHKYTVKVDVLSNAPAGATATLVASLTPSADITATGVTTRESVVPTPAVAVAGNGETILGVALTVTNLTQPAARSIAVGTQNFVWATTSLDATASGEDVRVSSVTVLDTLGVGNTDDMTALQNLSIWADLTSASSTRGDAYETKVSNNEQPTLATTKAINLTQVITVPKGTYVKIAVVGNLSTLAFVTDTHQISIAAPITATGKSTGNAPVIPAIITLGQVMLVSASGTLTASLDASTPLANIVVSGAQKVTVAAFKLTADNIEAIELDDLLVNDVAAIATNPVASNWYLYANSRADGGSIADPVAVAAGGFAPQFILADNTIVVPSNSSVVLTLKADIAPVDGATVINGDDLIPEITAAASINATGVSSGVPATIFNGLGWFPKTAATDLAFASKPTISLNASSPSGALVPSANTLVAIFNIAADSADDISFDDAGSAGTKLVVTMAEACTGAGGATNMILKDEGGTVLSTATEAADACTVGNKTFEVWTNPLVIAKGTTKKVYVYGVTTSATTAGDNLQASITDAAAGNVTWGINGAGAFATAAITARGSIYANALSR
ncbi:MAG: hypothetical protein WC460_00715 [Patescibacteria group bacterium]